MPPARAAPAFLLGLLLGAALALGFSRTNAEYNRAPGATCTRARDVASPQVAPATGRACVCAPTLVAPEPAAFASPPSRAEGLHTFLDLPEKWRREVQRCRFRALRPPPHIAPVNIGGNGVGPDMPGPMAWLWASRGLGHYNQARVAEHAPRKSYYHVHPFQAPGGENTSLLVRFEDAAPVWSDALFARVKAIADRGDTLSPHDYPHGAEDIMLACRTFFGEHAPQTALVVSALTPWVEVALLRWGVSRVYTVDFNPPVVAPGHGVTAVSLSEMWKHAGSFSLVISFSGIEHDGLGRYGDPLDPDGDYSAAAETAAMVAPGGTLLLGVPTGAMDDVEGQGHRVYGPVRFPRLVNATNLDLIGRVWDGRIAHGHISSAGDDPPIYATSKARFFPDTGQFMPTWQWQPVFALRRHPGAPPGGRWRDPEHE